jgi:hypothetical protein
MQWNVEDVHHEGNFLVVYAPFKYRIQRPALVLVDSGFLARLL